MIDGATTGADFATIAGGSSNTIDHGDLATIGGGSGNRASGRYACIPGGTSNVAAGQGSFAAGQLAEALHDGSVVFADSDPAPFVSTAPDQFLIQASGGVGIGTAAPNADLDVEGEVSFGTGNGTPGLLSSILGGEGSTLDADHSVVGGGRDNTVSSPVHYSTIGGGRTNSITTDINYPVNAGSISGGFANSIDTGRYGTIGGGRGNIINGATTGADYATIAGGILNTIDHAHRATIGGGSSNIASGEFACIPGGKSNVAAGRSSFAAGHFAEALHDGSIVFADSDPAPFVSTAPDQFLIQASGGVGIGTNAPARALDVVGSVRSSAGHETTNPNNPAAAVTLSWLNDVARIRIGGSGTGAQNGLDIQTTGSVSLMRITGSGKVGIGTGNGSIDGILHVQSSNARVAKFDRFGSDGELVAWARNDTVVGNVTVASGVVSYNAFTGSHYAWSESEPEVGALLVLTGENRSLADERAREIVYGVEPCAVPNDPACLGSYVSTTTIGDGEMASAVRLVAAVGNSDLWVIHTGKGIAPGDLLIASGVSGCAMLDDPGRFAVGHVVARAAEPVDWSRFEPDAQGVRRARISVLFDAFTRGFDAAAEVAALRVEIDDLRATLAR